MRNAVLLVFCLFAVSILKSQNNYWIKLYPLQYGLGPSLKFDYDPENLEKQGMLLSEKEAIGAPFFGVEIEKPNGRSWEFSLLGFPGKYNSAADVWDDNNIGKIKKRAIELQVETSKPFKDKNNKIKFSWGVFANLSNRKGTFVPHVDRTNWFRLEKEETGIMLGIIPRMQLRASSRFYFDFNVFFNAFEFAYRESFVGNPTFAPRQQKTGIFDFDLGGIRFNFRMGASWRLNRTKQSDSK
jgi:hypothetical protein